ncbi:PAS domain S-box protein [bacterium]|nr:PAS domain S-box protein [bacterium]
MSPQKKSGADIPVQAFLDIAGVIFLALDRNGCVSMINQKGCDLLGYREESIIGKEWFQHFLPKEMVRQVRSVFRKVMRGELEGTEYFENPVITRSGESKLIAWHNVYLKNERGQITGTLSSGVDITQRRRAEEELKSSESLSKALLGAIPDLMFRMSAEGNILDFYAADETMLFAAPDQFLGKAVDAVLPPDVSSVCLVNISKVLRKRHMHMFEYSLTFSTDHVRTYEARMVPCLKNEVLTIVRDISERKQSERILADSEARFRHLFESMAQGVVYQAADGKIISANPAAERILGLSIDQMQGRTSADPRWHTIHEDGTDFPGDTHPAMIALKTGKKVLNTIMGVFNPQDEVMHWIHINAVPQFREGEKTPYQVFTTFDDITERILAEHRIDHLNRTLEAVRHVDALIVRESDPSKLIPKICEELTRTRGYVSAWIVWMTADMEIIETAYSGLSKRHTAIFKSLKQQVWPYCIRESLENDAPMVVHRPDAGCMNCILSDIAPNGTTVTLRIMHNRRFYGLMSVVVSGVFPMDQDETGLVGEIADDIGLAFHNWETEQDRLKSEIMLRENEEQLENIFNHAPFVMLMLDEETRILKINQRGLDFAGLTEKNVLESKGGDAFSCIHAADDPGGCGLGEVCRDCKVRNTVLQTLRTGEAMDNVEAVLLVRHKKTIREYFINLSCSLVSNSPEKRILVTFEDITDEKQAKQELIESENKYRFITENLHDVIWILDPETACFSYISPSVYELQGYTPEEICAVPFYENMLPDDPGTFKNVLKTRMREFVETGEKQVYTDEFILQRKDGPSIWAEVVSYFQFNFRTGAIELIGSTRDITSRKKIEMNLAEANRLNQDIIQNSQDGIIVYGPDLKYRVWNPSMEKISGIPGRDVIGRHPADLFPFLKESGFIRQLEALLAGAEFEAREMPFAEFKSGKEGWVSDWSIPMKDENGNIIGILGTVRDITARKQAELALLERENKLRSLFRASPTGIGVVHDRHFTEVNDMILNMTGYTSEELLGQSARMVYPSQEEFEMAGRVKYGQIQEYGTGTVETRWKKKNGKIIDVLLSSTPLDPLDLGKGVTFTALDITDRKTTENALKESEERYRCLVEAAPICVFILSEGRYAFSNSFGASLLGYNNPDDLIGTDALMTIAPEYRDTISGRMQKAAGGEINPPQILQMLTTDKRRVWLETLSLPIVLESKREILVIGNDISLRIAAIESLRLSEDRLKKAEAMAHLGHWEFDVPAGAYFWSDEFYRICGLEPQSLKPTVETALGLLHPDDRKSIQAALQQVIDRGGSFDLESRIMRPDRSVRIVHSVGELVSDNTGRPIKLIGSFHDITDRKIAEQNVIAEKERAQQYLDVAGVMFIALDNRGLITLANQKVSEILGIREREIIGMNWFDHFIPQNEREYVRSVFSEILSGKVELNEYVESPVLTKNRSKRIIAWHNTILWNNQGQIMGTLSSGEDITERKKAEEHIRASLEEKEILLQEIHHRVKNNLAIINSLLNLQSIQLANKEQAVEAFKESVNRIHSMALVHEILYRSKDFSRIHFGEYIERLIGELVQVFHTGDRVRINSKIQNVRLDLNRAIPCGLILNELITNAMKYAFPKRRSGEIAVTFSTLKSGFYSLTVSDNGVGLPDDLDIKTSESLGLNLIRILVDQIDGTLDVSVDKGTWINIRFPVKPL